MHFGIKETLLMKHWVLINSHKKGTHIVKAW